MYTPQVKNIFNISNNGPGYQEAEVSAWKRALWDKGKESTFSKNALLLNEMISSYIGCRNHYLNLL